MILYLIRHGESLANASRLVTGTPTDPLIEPGIRQAQLLGEWLRQSSLRIDRFITSNWRRAQQTAQIILPDKKWIIEPRLGETNAGIVSDWTRDKFLQEYPFFYQDHTNPYPGGESHLDLQCRVLEWLTEIQSAIDPDDAVALVSHSGPIACIIQFVLHIGMNRFPALLPAHASLSIVEFSCTMEKKGPILHAFSLVPAGRVSSMGDGGK